MIRATRWRTLALATTGFNLSFLLWLSLAPFLAPISSTFGLSLAETGLLASAPFWMAPFGRPIAGWLADRRGAPPVFGALLVGAGLAALASAFVESYAAFFGLRLLVGAAGVTFVVGVQHVAQWFPAEEVGTATGIYAGVGNAGAGVGALVLPWAFGTDWRTASATVGLAAVGLGVVYVVVGVDAAAPDAAAAAAERATVRGLLFVGTRYGVLVLALAYVTSLGLVLALNNWLPTYFGRAFDSGLAVAGSFAGAFGVTAGVSRPIGGYVSDRLGRRERDLLPALRGRYREQWTVVCLLAVVASLASLTLAGRSGSAAAVVAVAVALGGACGCAGGAIFAQVPQLFPRRTGAVSGVVGSVGTVGGVTYSLALPAMADVGVVHGGFLVLALTALPAVALAAFAFRPARADWFAVAGFAFDDVDGSATDD